MLHAFDGGVVDNFDVGVFTLVLEVGVLEGPSKLGGGEFDQLVIVDVPKIASVEEGLV